MNACAVSWGLALLRILTRAQAALSPSSLLLPSLDPLLSGLVRAVDRHDRMAVGYGLTKLCREALAAGKISPSLSCDRALRLGNMAYI